MHPVLRNKLQTKGRAKGCSWACSAKLTISLHFAVAFYCNCNNLHMNATHRNYGEMSGFLVKNLLNETLTDLNISSAKWYHAALTCDP